MLSYLRAGRPVPESELEPGLGLPLRGRLIALHGVTDSAASLCGIAGHFGDQWDVLLVDHLGHGLSPRLSPAQLEAPIQAMVEAAEQLLEELNLPAAPTLLWGHSMGGAVAAHLAVRHPEWFTALVLEDPALLTESQYEQYRQAGTRELTEFQRADLPAAISRLTSAYPHWSAAEVAGWAQGKAQVDLEFLATGIVGELDPHLDLLDQLQTPTLLLTGDAPDVLIGPNRLADAPAHVQTVLIPQASHTVRRDQPGAVYTAVEAFIPSWTNLLPPPLEEGRTEAERPR
ncbi:alpha/beta fold hydrolase [Corynebacterium sp. 153RC1]|uniref:alpha/beta fold hydrolase n=1 Tax=unclassified Corynebacterium TaxID=2624378 RepID=UPI00211C071C|nr:alpha/beta fold hydrolase [Corynebacterium sp. 209RC1]MCQ9354541.1 alpha/beta fold hydrolase [Corynebacterium sp. 1222RC1]MCQ9356087.1 alpha/beta fold hydrolase [Corynebacterium sp. 122RC1]MCQ9358719.1 alpha/beta fold hydrolase [Corynebacterium sp. 142RC1]MCQ9360701.1 alpha/beta fold hydrolase [Corynebacterium sp. 153RC1]MCQ9363225.1 alpha/beta fold hydrolase [Corynebacterium sp. 732RC1]MCQ9364528.1 alpha/beta fold hydrolase [Corynebacterium sp. 70RC1]MCQ9370496.1 alpha/beta fold hydrolas